MVRYANMEELVNGYHYGHSDSGQIGTGTLYFTGGVLYSYGSHFPIAVRHSGGYLMNGSRYSATTDKHQARARQVLGNQPTLPFDMLCSAFGYSQEGLVNAIRMDKLEIVDSSTDTVKFMGHNEKGDPVYRHILGGALFRYDGRLFLGSIDPSGVGIGLYFITELMTQDVDTMEEAFESLKPDAVKKAEAEGRIVYRQGEFFFIRSDIDIPKVAIVKHKIIESSQPGRTNHHRVTEWASVDGQVYARGTARHTEGDHRMLKLYDDDTRKKDWFEIHENVQVQSWSVSGKQID